MIATFKVTLDKERVLTVDAGAMQRLKRACGIDLHQGDKMRTHHERCCFVWAMTRDETLRPEDLAPYLTYAKFCEITAAIENAREEMKKAEARLSGRRRRGHAPVWFSRS